MKSTDKLREIQERHDKYGDDPLYKRTKPFPKTRSDKDFNTITFMDDEEIFNLVDWQAMLQSEVGILKLRLIAAHEDRGELLDALKDAENVINAMYQPCEKHPYLFLTAEDWYCPECKLKAAEAALKEIDALPDKWLATRTNEMYTSQQADGMGGCAIELKSILDKHG